MKPGDEIAWVKAFNVISIGNVLDPSGYLNAQDAIDVISLGQNPLVPVRRTFARRQGKIF